MIHLLSDGFPPKFMTWQKERVVFHSQWAKKRRNKIYEYYKTKKKVNSKSKPVATEVSKWWAWKLLNILTAPRNLDLSTDSSERLRRRRWISKTKSTSYRSERDEANKKLFSTRVSCQEVVFNFDIPFKRSTMCTLASPPSIESLELSWSEMLQKDK